MGFNSSSNASQGVNTGSSAAFNTSYGSEVWNQQAPYLQALYNQGIHTQANTQGQYAANQANQQIGQNLGYMAQGAQYGQDAGWLADVRNATQGQIYGGERDFISQPGGNPYQGFYQGGAPNSQWQGRDYSGQAYQDQGGAPGTFSESGVSPLADVYARQLGQQFNRSIAPAIRGEAAVAGGLGGSRQQIGLGLAAGEVGQQMADFNAQLYEGQANRALAANQTAQQAYQAAQGRRLAGYQTQMEAAQQQEQRRLGGYQTDVAAGQSYADRMAQGWQSAAQNYLGGQSLGLQAQEARQAGFTSQQAQRLAAAQLAGQTWQGAQQAGLAANTGIGANAQFGMGIPWYSLQQQAGLLGKPFGIDKGGASSATSSTSGTQQSSGGGKGFSL